MVRALIPLELRVYKFLNPIFSFLSRMSGTNNARLYDMVLAGQGLYPDNDPDWDLGKKLTTEHVWDSFVILSLLEEHERKGEYLSVPHGGSQDARFKAAMDKRNKEYINEGLPDAVTHECDKCARVYTEPDGTQRESNLIARHF